MEDQVTRLVDKVWDKFLQTPPEKRFMIAIGGIPGSGKTTLSRTVTDALNARHATLDPSHPAYASTPVATFVPMDGFHLTRAQLSAMPDPATAHARRGAEFTFDGARYLALVQALRRPLPVPSSSAVAGAASDAAAAAATVWAPSFDHAVKDPVENDIAIRASHRLVVLEGNYTCLDRGPWRAAAALMDELWFVDVGPTTARRRLVRRHVAAGIVKDENAAARRADENDLVNGAEILAARLPLDELIVSREDPVWEEAS